MPRATDRNSASVDKMSCKSSFIPAYFVCALMTCLDAGSPRLYDQTGVTCDDDSGVSTCDDILSKHLSSLSCEEEGPPFCSLYNDIQDESFYSYTINDTRKFQPSITLEVNSTAFRNNNGATVVDAEGYVIGYKDCSSNSTQVCYLYISTLPGEENDWIHIVRPPSDSAVFPVGDQCTFFGCFQYCLFKADCVRVRRDFLNENITILGTCPIPDMDIEHGNVTIFSQKSDMEGRNYVEGTVLTVTCDEGYIASDGGKTVCQRNGVWNPQDIPTCTVITCPDLDGSIGNGTANVIITPEEPTLEGHYVEGTIVTVSCKEGYVGGGNSTCQRNGTWTSVSCSLLMAIPPSPVGGHDNSNTVLLWTTVLPVGALMFAFCTTIVFVCSCKEYKSSRKTKIKLLNNIFATYKSREILDPNFNPIDISLHKTLPHSLSLCGDDYSAPECDILPSDTTKVAPYHTEADLDKTNIGGDEVDILAKESGNLLDDSSPFRNAESRTVATVDMLPNSDSGCDDWTPTTTTTTGNNASVYVDVTNQQVASYDIEDTTSPSCITNPTDVSVDETDNFHVEIEPTTPHKPITAYFDPSLDESGSLSKATSAEQQDGYVCDSYYAVSSSTFESSYKYTCKSSSGYVSELGFIPELPLHQSEQSICNSSESTPSPNIQTLPPSEEHVVLLTPPYLSGYIQTEGAFLTQKMPSKHDGDVNTFPSKKNNVMETLETRGAGMGYVHNA